MKRWHIAVFAVAMLCDGAFAGEPEHSETLLDRLPGNWVLSGKLAGQETTHDIAADWALNRGYLRIHEISREKVPSGTAFYEAIIFISYNAKTDDYTCLWLDSTSNEGLVAEGFGHAKRSANSLPFVFRDASGQVSFENTFMYDPTSDSWNWVMDNVEAGKRKPFGRVTLVKLRSQPKGMPNQSSEPTPPSVTDRAAARSAPAGGVAHL
jgi:hypothetical protein